MRMITLWHQPIDFAFYICDPTVKVRLGLSVSAEMAERRLVERDGIVIVGVLSEFTTIPIAVELAIHGIEPSSRMQWDRIEEGAIEVRGNRLSFQGGVGDEFASVEIEPGRYHLRVHYGGQHTEQPDGSTEDFYLIQIWPEPRDLGT